MTGVLWTGDEFLKAVGGRVVGTAPSAISGISIDTRTLMPGEAFFAIKGERVDGHDYVRDALDNHASVVVVEESKLGRFSRVQPAILVEDVLKALERVAAAARARSRARIVAVTGSVGKTSTKEMLRLVLSTAGLVHASAASHNNHWGVPLTLSRLPPEAQFGVFEIGMNHAGEITPLTKMVRPHIAVVTNVEPVHLEYFPSVEAIADAKAEIFSGLEPGGFAVLNADNPHFERLSLAAIKAGGEVMSFGQAKDANARLLMHSVLSDRTAVTASVLGKDVAYHLGAPGGHLVSNSLAALLAARLIEVDVKEAAAALAEFRPSAGRGERHVLAVNGGRAILLDESYNANPASMRAAIALLGQTKGTRRIAVLGDMLELGEKADDMHRDLLWALEKARIDLLFCAGPHMRALYEAVPEKRRGGWAEASSDLEPRVVDAIRPNDAIMVKGSNGSRMSLIVKALNARFSAGKAPA